MKKKVISLLLSVAIIASMTVVTFATIEDNPKACRLVPLIEEISAK